MFKYNFNSCFKDVVNKFPNKTALIETNGKGYTYKKLDLLSDYFASDLEVKKKKFFCCLRILF